jgi:hypothetical protein
LLEVNIIIYYYHYNQYYYLLLLAEQLEGTVHSEIRNIARKADIYKELCLNGLKSGAANLYSAVTELSNIYIDDLITSPGIIVSHHY